ncbi:MAG: crossover junction endodeoxyribonuclease RuvC [Patescibacteria group bacterium]
MPDKKPKTILGIDPGYARAGWSILESSGQNLKLIDCGCLETTKETQHATRLKFLHTELNKIIRKYKPEILSVEDLFFFKNLKTAIKVAEARGVILITAIENDLEIKEFTPLQIKQALVGYGRAEKKQIQQMVKMILNLEKIPQPDDAADAIAVAITCVNSTKKYG